MTLNRDDKIKLWANNTARREFLKKHVDWDEWVRVDELNLVFRKFEVTKDKWIVAMEYQSSYPSYYPKDAQRVKSVKYYIHDPAHSFAPYSEQEVTLTDLLKREKVRLQKEKRAETK